ncbi:MAG: hypothetical protein EXS37_11715 [Opitutus sp.]|nr:hypothetical protein [Opitutus sp.]
MHRAFFVSAALCVATALSAAEPAPAIANLTYSGDQQALVALDADLSAAGTDPAKLGALETRLLALIRRGDLTFAARQAIAQRLGAVLAQAATPGRADAYKQLGSLLTDDRDSDLVRLALDRVPGATIDPLFLAALGKTTGRTRLGIIDTLARRRTTGAVPALTKLLKHADAPTATAAARALGEIADPAAVAALQAMPEPSSAAIAAAKLTAASRMPAVAALGLLREMEKSAGSPVNRAAAFRLSLDLDPGSAATRIAETLGGKDWTLKQVALEAITASKAPNLVTTLLAKLSGWDAPTQSGVIAALARRGEASAVSAIVTAAAHPDAEVRAAALVALGQLPGNREVAMRLAKVAVATNTDHFRLARASLAQLAGPEVDAAVFAGAEGGEAWLRSVYLEQLALRNQSEGIPLLLKTRADPDAAVRSAAVGALGDLAPTAQQQALIDWTIAAKDEAEQTRALRALVNVTLRNPAVEERGRAVFAAIEQATPEVALRLLPALQRIGGTASADCAARLAVRNDQKISDAATSALTRWTDRTALPALATVAEKAALPATRTAAVEGTLRYFERNREKWSPESTTLVSRLLASAKDAAPRRKLVALLTRAGDQSALTLAESLVTDAALADDARYAAAVIRSNLAGKPKLRASSSESLSSILDGKTTTRWSVPALGEEWVEVAFAASRPLRRITLDQTGRAAEFPEHYELYVTDDPKTPGPAVASGPGQSGNKTVIDLPAGTSGRFVIIKNTQARPDAPWAICELLVD